MILVGFCAGCAATAAARVAVPSAHAASNAPRWEYACIDELDKEHFARLGSEGWELAAAATPQTPALSDAVVWCFKRPLQ